VGGRERWLIRCRRQCGRLLRGVTGGNPGGVFSRSRCRDRCGFLSRQLSWLFGRHSAGPPSGDIRRPIRWVGSRRHCGGWRRRRRWHVSG
jgi:hypothetical protein